MKKLLFFLPLVLLFLTSCESSDPKNEVTVNAFQVNRIINTADNSIRMTNCQYAYRVDYITATIDITIPSLKLAETDESVSFAVTGLKLSSSSKTGLTYKASAPFTPVINGKEDSKYSVTSLSGIIFNNELKLNLEISSPSGTFKVFASESDAIYSFGNTVITNLRDVNADPFKREDIAYVFSLDPSKKTASLFIANAKFATLMPEIAMTFSGLTLEPTATGYKITGTDVIPTSNNIPYQKYIITDFNGTLENDKVNFSFVCAGTFKVDVTATMNSVTE
ncbi:MAG: hypothetical protein PHR45_01490 [Muribaculaceae bacterium]|nr:hypothetical protein [Muribaculaceae bacterium]